MILIDSDGKEWELREKLCEVKACWYWSDLAGLVAALVAAHLIFI